MANDKTSKMAVEARRLYSKEWRAKNKDKVKKHNATFWAKRGKELAEQKKAAK